MAIYTGVTVVVDGKVLAEETSIEYKAASGKNPVNTVGKGYAGYSLGAGVDEISISGVVPSSGMEINVGDLVHDALLASKDASISVTHNIVLMTDTESYSATIDFYDGSIGHGVNKETNFTLNGKCSPSRWR